LQRYNCQPVDEANQIIVAQSLGKNASDSGDFGSMTRKAARNTGEAPEAMLAGSGYWSEEPPEEADKMGTEAYIHLNRASAAGKKAPELFRSSSRGGLHAGENDPQAPDP
jgi:hypothetical protein